MDNSYWQRQEPGKPLFASLLWSRPENRLHAGKLLIIGGSGYEFKAPANAYGDVLAAGAGNAKVLLPDSMKKLMQEVFPEAEFAPSTPSGSFARAALATALDMADWADAVLLAGDFGRNSETAILLESVLEKHQGQITITGDALDYFIKQPELALRRKDTCIVATFEQLQKIAAAAGTTKAFTSSMDLIHFVEGIHELSQKSSAHIITRLQDIMIVASRGDVTTTRLGEDKKTWPGETAANASVWWLQNPNNPIEALTSSLIA